MLYVLFVKTDCLSHRKICLFWLKTVIFHTYRPRTNMKYLNLVRKAAHSVENIEFYQSSKQLCYSSILNSELLNSKLETQTWQSLIKNQPHLAISADRTNQKRFDSKFWYKLIERSAKRLFEHTTEPYDHLLSFRSWNCEAYLLDRKIDEKKEVQQKAATTDSINDKILSLYIVLISLPDCKFITHTQNIIQAQFCLSFNFQTLYLIIFCFLLNQPSKIQGFRTPTAMRRNSHTPESHANVNHAAFLSGRATCKLTTCKIGHNQNQTKIERDLSTTKEMSATESSRTNLIQYKTKKRPWLWIISSRNS